MMANEVSPIFPTGPYVVAFCCPEGHPLKKIQVFRV